MSRLQKDSLINLISGEQLPYQLAMLDYLGFVKHLEVNYFQTKNELCKNLSLWLNSDIAGRTVKGNLSTLGKKSNENKAKYTAHLHKEAVKNDYLKLK